MAEKEKRVVSNERCQKVEAGQTGNKTVEHAKVAKEIYNQAKTQIQDKKK